MNYVCYSPESTGLLKRVEDLLAEPDALLWQEQMRIDFCPSRVHLIYGQTSSQTTDVDIVPSKKEIFQLHEIRDQLVEALNSGFTQFYTVVERLDQLGQRVNEPFEFTEDLIYQFPHISSDPNDYFIFIYNEQKLSNLLHDLHYLAHLWQFEEGRLLLHASAVIHQGGIYLFCGRSGVGKSTIAVLSKESGDVVLDEDIVAIYQTASGGYSANAWGYNTTLSDLPIRAFFFLYQDNEDRVVPLAQMKAAVHVWDQSFIVYNTMLPIEKRSQLFSRAAEFARQIPGYELYFRKSPDFWKLIEAEIKVG